MPWRPPALCDSCANKILTGDPFEDIETCLAFPAGIPYDIVNLGGEHFSTEGTGSEVIYEMRGDGEDALAGWISWWYSPEDGYTMEEGVTGILPEELLEGNT